jgi:hypothetical protein
MSRESIRIEVNGRLAFSGWSDEPIPIAIKALGATIERVNVAVAAIERLEAIADQDEEAGYRNAHNYADAYANAGRLIREALMQP